jgi:hypothetical protein
MQVKMNWSNGFVHKVEEVEVNSKDFSVQSVTRS